MLHLGLIFSWPIMMTCLVTKHAVLNLRCSASGWLSGSVRTIFDPNVVGRSAIHCEMHIGQFSDVIAIMANVTRIGRMLGYAETWPANWP